MDRTLRRLDVDFKFELKSPSTSCLIHVNDNDNTDSAEQCIDEKADAVWTRMIGEEEPGRGPGDLPAPAPGAGKRSQLPIEGLPRVALGIFRRDGQAAPHDR
ncbi:hypothetical protein GCM10027445_26470 [Amycolatopsis endophytica]